jgi:D-hydroxyproline dehydrogenase subunit gamma
MTAGPGRIAGGVRRGPAFRFTVDGEAIAAHPGETIAAALLAAGRRITRRTERRGEARGPFCAIGVCHECRMVVDGEPNVRACVTSARAGMVVTTQDGLGPAPDDPR